MREHQADFGKWQKRFWKALLVTCVLTFLFAAFHFSSVPVKASEQGGNSATDNVTSDTIPYEIGINFTTNGEDGGLTATLQILIILTVIGLAPSILIMLTSFTRIIVVLHFTRTALTTQTTPPNQVLIGLALFLTLFIMAPTLSEINTQAIQPLTSGEITAEEAFDRGLQPLRTFMLKQLGGNGAKDIQLFMDISGTAAVDSTEEIPTTVLIPSFIISELRKAFIMGFLIYIPFLIIDMVVASTLMSMGMMMLPPTTISMPFKILLFIMVDGWNLLIGDVVKTFVR